MITGELKSKIGGVWQTPCSGTHHMKDASFVVPKAEIAANGYDLSINRYKEVVYEAVEYGAPRLIMAQLEEEIAEGRAELEGLM